MTDDPKAPASTETTDAIDLSLDADAIRTLEANESSTRLGAAGQASRSTKLDPPPSSRNTVLDLPHEGAAPEASASVATPTAPDAEASASLDLQLMPREVLIDAAFTAPGAMEWLDRLALA